MEEITTILQAQQDLDFKQLIMSLLPFIGAGLLLVVFVCALNKIIGISMEMPLVLAGVGLITIVFCVSVVTVGSHSKYSRVQKGITLLMEKKGTIQNVQVFDSGYIITVATDQEEVLGHPTEQTFNFSMGKDLAKKLEEYLQKEQNISLLPIPKPQV